MSDIRLYPLNKLTALAEDSDKAMLVVTDGSGSESDAADLREALKAVSSDVLFYDDFGRYGEGTSIGTGVTTPLVGPTYVQAFDVGSMVVENRGLRCPVNSNNYLGFWIPNYNGELDICFEIENRNPSGYYNTNGTGFTLAFKETEVVNADGSGIQPTGSMHLNINSQGVTDANQFSGTASTYIGPGSPSSAWGDVKGPNAIWRVRVRAKGDLLEISAFGRTLRWTNSSMPARLAGERIWMYFQLNNVVFAGLPAPAERTYALLRRVWANSPASSIAASFPGSGADAFEGNPPATYPNVLTVSPGGRPAFNSSAIALNPAMRIIGSAAPNASNHYTGVAAYCEGFFNMAPPTNDGGTVYRPVIARSAYLTAKVASPANAVLSNSLRGLAKQVNLQAGMTEYQRLAGTFGANGNTKQIQVKEAGGVIFDSGATTQNGGVWTLEITRQSVTGISEIFMFEFWSSTTGIVKSVIEINRGTTYTGMSLHAAGTAAGDVTIFHHTLACTQ